MYVFVYDLIGVVWRLSWFWRLGCFGDSLEVCLETLGSLETQLKNGMPPLFTSTLQTAKENGLLTGADKATRFQPMQCKTQRLRMINRELNSRREAITVKRVK